MKFLRNFGLMPFTTTSAYTTLFLTLTVTNHASKFALAKFLISATFVPSAAALLPFPLVLVALVVLIMTLAPVFFLVSPRLSSIFFTTILTLIRSKKHIMSPLMKALPVPKMLLFPRTSNYYVPTVETMMLLPKLFLLILIYARLNFVLRLIPPLFWPSPRFTFIPSVSASIAAISSFVLMSAAFTPQP